MNLLGILELLREEDPDIVLELLDISTDELLDAFLDKVEDRIDYIKKQYQD